MGVLVQNAAYAIVVPLYLIMYLSTSPLMSSKCKGNFLIDTSDTAAIPISIALGYVAPAILMSLPAPSVIDFQQKQTFMAIWQMFPLWVAILQAVLPYLTAAFLQDRTLSSKSSHSFELKVLRYIYVMLLVVAGIGQTSTATLIAASKWFPDVFAPGFKGIFDFHKVFVPAAIYPSAMMPSIGSGALMLLQYDELIGSTSMALFATVMYISACQGIKTSRSVVSLVFQGLAIAIVTGPLGFAVACIWARDEIIVESDKGDVKKVD